MKKDWRIFLDDIQKSIDKLEKYTSKITFDDFCKNEMLVDAVIRNLEIIGEASKFVPDEIKEKHSDIPWRAIVGLRNVLIHEYFGLDLENIWKIIVEDIPSLKNKIKRI